MAEKSSFFNSVNGDRKYSATDFAEYFRKFITNGFFPDDLNLKIIADNNDMSIVVKSGAAWINGYMYENTSDLSLQVEIADGVLDRIDRVIVQLSFIDREIRTLVKKGSPASSPVAPPLQRDADIYEIGIGTLYIPNGSTSVIQSNVTDTRWDSEIGGIVNNLFAESNIRANTVAVDDLNGYFTNDTVETVLAELFATKQKRIYVQSNAPANPQEGDIWIEV